MINVNGQPLEAYIKHTAKQLKSHAEKKRMRQGWNGLNLEAKPCTSPA